MKFFLDTKVPYQRFGHPLTDKGLDAFLADWAKLPEAVRGV